MALCSGSTDGAIFFPIKKRAVITKVMNPKSQCGTRSLRARKASSQRHEPQSQANPYAAAISTTKTTIQNGGGQNVKFLSGVWGNVKKPIAVTVLTEASSRALPRKPVTNSFVKWGNKRSVTNRTRQIENRPWNTVRYGVQTQFSPKKWSYPRRFPKSPHAGSQKLLQHRPSSTIP